MSDVTEVARCTLSSNTVVTIERYGADDKPYFAVCLKLDDDNRPIKICSKGYDAVSTARVWMDGYQRGAIERGDMVEIEWDFVNQKLLDG